MLKTLCRINEVNKLDLEKLSLNFTVYLKIPSDEIDLRPSFTSVAEFTRLIIQIKFSQKLSLLVNLIDVTLF